MPTTIDSFQQVEITSRSAWRSWLEKYHTSLTGIWLVTYKKLTGEKHVPYGDVVEEALCFGWVDSVGRRLDEQRTQLLLTPRKPRSAWSMANKVRIARLMKDGLMKPTGLAKIDAAKKDGSWDRLAASDALEEPEDLKDALAKNKDAGNAWRTFPPSARKATLEWLYAAKRPETRVARIEETVKLSAQGIRPRQWIRKDK